jgi:hypothetical protein
MISSVNQEVKLDEGLTNLGFTLNEAIMESVDDAFDAGATDVVIRILEEEFTEKIESHEVVSNRFSYYVLDNGPGTKVDDIFNFGKSKDERYKDVEDLYKLNGVYHYGMISPINVAKKVYFYSKVNGGNWSVNKLQYNVTSGEAVSKIENIEPNFSFFMAPDTNTIVYVSGISKSNLNSDSLTDFLIDLVKQLGITYREYLNQGFSIRVNDKDVKAIDPFMQEQYYVESGLDAQKTHEFKITLSDLINEDKDEIKKAELVAKFKHLFSEEKLLEQCIVVSVFLLNEKFKNINIDNPLVLEPSALFSGIYIKRNKRYIGHVAKIDGISTSHPQYNYFRAEILFSPIFDSFLRIQVNKNRYDITSSLYRLLEKELKRKAREERKRSIKGLLLTKTNKTKTIEELIKELQDSLAQAESIKITARNSGVNSQQLSQLETIIDKTNYFIDTTNKTVTLLENNDDLRTAAEEQLQILNDMKANILAEIEERKKVLLDSADKLKDRLKRAKYKRKSISIDTSEAINDFKGVIKEPLNEAEMYGVLYMMTHLFPSEFDFKLLDYNDSNHVDCLIEVTSIATYKNLKVKERFENQWDDNWNEEITASGIGGYAFSELKYLLGERSEIGHSLQLVSHLICWDIAKESLIKVEADDGIYVFREDREYLHSTHNKIKVIYLKKIVEELLLDEF